MMGAWGVIFIAMIGLGIWQLHRYEAKKQLEQLYLARSKSAPMMLSQAMALKNPDFSKAMVSGRFLFNKTIMLMHQSFNSQVGVNIYTPFLVAGKNQAILVDRGWIALNQLAHLRKDQLFVGVKMNIEGYLFLPQSRFHLGDAIVNVGASPLHVQTINTKMLGQAIGLTLYPYVLRIDQTMVSALTPNWKHFNVTSLKHLGYAIQWFLMALILLGLMVYLFKKALTRE